MDGVVKAVKQSPPFEKGRVVTIIPVLIQESWKTYGFYIEKFDPHLIIEMTGALEGQKELFAQIVVRVG